MYVRFTQINIGYLWVNETVYCYLNMSSFHKSHRKEHIACTSDMSMRYTVTHILALVIAVFVKTVEELVNKFNKLAVRSAYSRLVKAMSSVPTNERYYACTLSLCLCNPIVCLRSNLILPTTAFAHFRGAYVTI